MCEVDVTVGEREVEELFALTKRAEVVFRSLLVEEEGLSEEARQKIALMAADPGRIARVVDNPLGGHPEQRGSREFFEMSRALREEIRGISAQNAGEGAAS